MRIQLASCKKSLSSARQAMRKMWKIKSFPKCCKGKLKQKARENRKTQYVKEMHTPKQQQTVVCDSGTESDSDEYMYAVNDNQNTDESQPNKVKK